MGDAQCLPGSQCVSTATRLGRVGALPAALKQGCPGSDPHAQAPELDTLWEGPAGLTLLSQGPSPMCSLC